MKVAMILIALLIAGQANAALTAAEQRGADLFFGCSIDITLPGCTPGSRVTVLNGNGRDCYDCHRGPNNFGLAVSHVPSIQAIEPYYTAAQDIPGLDSLLLLPHAIVSTPFGFRSISGLTHIKNDCDAAGECSRPLGQMGQLGTNLCTIYRQAVEHHLTKSLARVPNVDFDVLTDQQCSDLTAWIRSNAFQAIASVPIQ